MSPRVFIVFILAAAVGVAAFAFISGGKAASNRAAHVKVEAAADGAARPVTAAAPADAPAEPAIAEPAPAAAPVAATEATSQPLVASTLSQGDLVKFVGKKFMSGAPGIKKVALTFDDGPYANTTPQVLEILKQENIRATFFMLGQSVEKYPDVARMVADAGHEIGCHTINHTNLGKKGADVIQLEVVEAAKFIEQTTGRKPQVFRPPFGTYNATVLGACREAGMVLVTWSVDTNDWRKGSSSESIYAACMKQTNNGGVILLHDTHEKSVQALPSIIKELKVRGYEFVTVGEMIAETARQPAALIAGVAETEPLPAQPRSIPLSKSGI